MQPDQEKFTQPNRQQNGKDANSTHRIDVLSRNVVSLGVGILLGGAVAMVGLPAIQEYFASVMFGLLGLIFIVVCLVFVIVQKKEWILKKVFRVNNTDLSELKESGMLMLESMQEKEYAEAKKHFGVITNKVVAWYSWMSFRRWILTVVNVLFISFGGLLGTVLLYNQNKLLLHQNQLMERQNYRLDQQTYLQEAERRSSMIFLMGNLLDAMDEELKRDIGQNSVRDLSPQIIGRVIALSNGLRPYRYLDSDSLIPRELSPERGQLLVSLINSQIDNRSLDKIFQFADFSYADLTGAVLGREYMGRINLRKADLGDADLSGVDMMLADLSQAKLNGTILARANLRKSNLSETDFRETILSAVDLRGASLYGADLRGVDLFELDLRGAYLENTQLDSALVPDGQWQTKLLQLSPDSVPRGSDLTKRYRTDSMTHSDGSKTYFLARQ
ncbi:MAG: pentapeptide repeat-containing protein [Saprospiraceae bacterium]|nr:pentapeptide repeat-containing protein [Saprospiraceae bacterium]